jgi:hypothetical protein
VVGDYRCVLKRGDLVSMNRLLKLWEMSKLHKQAAVRGAAGLYGLPTGLGSFCG